ncbi:MAG: DUF1616 domain-containing protein [Thermoplasmata archaeon]|nr:DUF1616 domain-containing protein [Thermoplasmata archaeon]
MGANPVEVVVGLLLVFALPGFALTRALFPEWRLRGPDALERIVETATLSLVTSVALTVLVGFALLNGPGGGFQASWSQPVLEGVLAGIAAVGFAIALVRGGFSKTAPSGPAPEASPGVEGAWELLRRLEGLYRQERRLRHEIRGIPAGSPRAAELSQQLEQVRSESDRLKRAREAEYGS